MGEEDLPCVVCFVTGVLQSVTTVLFVVACVAGGRKTLRTVYVCCVVAEGTMAIMWCLWLNTVFGESL